MKAPEAFRTISEVASDLDLPQHVLRFWETRFTQIKPMKRGGGRRYYRPEDIDLLRGVRLLLYSEGFTIRGVQRLLKEKGVAFVVEVGQTGSVETVTAGDERDEPDDIEAAAPPKAVPEPAKPSVRVSAPAMAPPVAAQAAVAPPVVISRIAPEGRRRIEAALSDLLEAKRLLDTARS